MKSNLWKTIEESLNRGEQPRLFINRAGKICLADGGNELPAKLAAKMPNDILSRAMAISEARAAEERERSETLRRRYVRRQAELDSQLDDPGFVLLAGDETEVVAQGTLRECHDNLFKVTRLRCDSYSGKGCWLITKNDMEIESGEFTRHGLI